LNKERENYLNLRFSEEAEKLEIPLISFTTLLKLPFTARKPKSI